MLTGILGVLRLPPQYTFWRFLASLHGSVAGQLLEVQRCMRQRVWEAANVKLSAVVLDTDTTVHTLFGNQMGARKGAAGTCRFGFLLLGRGGSLREREVRVHYRGPQDGASSGAS